MTVAELNKYYQEHPVVQKLVSDIKEKREKKFRIKGLVCSSKSLVIANVFQKHQKNFLIVLDDSEEASYLHNDLSNIIGAKYLLFFPSSYKRSVQYNQTDKANMIMRTEVLNTLSNSAKPYIIITYPEALIERVVPKKQLKENVLHLIKGENISIEFLNEVLFEYKFDREDFVYEPGQYAIRGSIVDIFSFSSPYPYRVDFFGDEVESIRTFDIETQLSKETVENITIVPNIQNSSEVIQNAAFIDYIDDKSIIWTKDLQFLVEKSDSIIESTLSKYKGAEAEQVGKQLATGQYMLSKIKDFTLIEFGHNHTQLLGIEYTFRTSPQPIFHKKFDLLGENLVENKEKNFKNIFFTENINQVQRLEDIFKEVNSKVVFDSVLISLHEGFVDEDANICCYTDHQIFERYHKHKVKKEYVSKESITINEINNLQQGDYVVHVDHGIGKFEGLERMETNGKVQEAIKLLYHNNDILYVSIHNLHRISKYKGKDGAPPKVHKLGSGVWQRTKEKTKSKVKDIAKDLIALYAERKAQKGFQFSPDSYLQTELEASFFYEDTPDQLKATKAVKKAMESDFPMDLLVCGDVGFGKTEVAIRAAFKAVADNKQVAVLVPTTILALQHYKTFSARLKDFPCNVEYISRLRKTKEQKETLKKVAEGSVDILIGTHRLVGKDVKFKELGLLIIDEEQKFGVSTKEKLKQFKTEVDTLTLTATPIPRTLQFSLLGARDLAIINTPPPNRHPIITELHQFSDDILREAIVNELERNGQVFIINNRIHNIYELEALVQRVCPGARTVVGHGQMEGSKLEAIMLDFINGEYDVLIATTIIESGLDIPNANTIIINDAQNFGLSELHQLRGRVGRSNKKAFCYLLAPPLHLLTQDARRRLTALEEFSALGSGFNIAMQDLDIRGAGNLLGGEQSGFISDIGYETYQKILDEAIQELKETEFKEFYASSNEEPELGEGFCFVKDCTIDTDLALHLPEFYVQNTAERIKLYRELDNIEEEEELLLFKERLLDRFGVLPAEVEALIEVVRLRWNAISLGFERILLKNGIMICYFISNQESAYYQSKLFGAILQFVQHNAKHCVMQEKNNKLSLRYAGVNSIYSALDKLKEIIESVK